MTPEIIPNVETQRTDNQYAIKAPQPLFKAEEVTKAIQTLVEPNEVFEIRALGAESFSQRNPTTMNGYFTDAATAVKNLQSIRTAKGIYITLNPVVPDLMAVRSNRIDFAKSGETTSDAQIAKYRWLLIDCDPQRPSSAISATDTELADAISRTQEIQSFLSGKGLPAPVIAVSGNGGHLLYRIDLPTQNGELVKKFLKALSQQFSDASVKVDEAVFNPARITKLYGTLVCKGDNLPDRPHRYSCISSTPTELIVVSPAQLQDVASMYMEPVTTTYSTVNSNSRSGNGQSDFDVRDFLKKHDIEIKREHKKGKLQVIELKNCPFNPEHGDHGEVAVFVHDDGTLGFKCHHESCVDNHWQEFRLHFEPNCYSRFPASNDGSGNRTDTLTSALVDP